MPTSNPSAIVDAIVYDLTAPALGLNPYTTRSYAQPRVTPPDSCPRLAVWTEQTNYDLITAAAGLEAYERRHDVTVAWYVATDQSAETGGTGDARTVHDLYATTEIIIARLKTYASGVPGFGNQLVATLRSRRIEPEEGCIWQALIELTVEEAT